MGGDISIKLTNKAEPRTVIYAKTDYLNTPGYVDARIDGVDYFRVKANLAPNDVFYLDEWEFEVIPDPLPTKMGAIIRVTKPGGNTIDMVRLGNSVPRWDTLVLGITWGKESILAPGNTFTVLFEGID